MIKVSILVPVYNVENYIQRCAVSLFEQTYPNIEYIFVDDASPDRSIELLHKILKKYPVRKSQVKIFTHKHNRGLAVARNTAFEQAMGDFIFIVDSDDYIEHTTIEMMVRCQEATKSDLILANYYIHTSNGVKEVVQPSFTSKEEFVRCMIGLNTYHTVWNKLIRRNIIENHHIRTLEGCNVGEDLIIMSQVAYYVQSFAKIDAFTYHYNAENPISYSSRVHKQITEEIATSLMKTVAFTKSFFKDKEDVYYQKAAINEFHHYYLCLSHLNMSGQRQTYKRISEQFYPADTRNWPLPSWKKIIYRLAFSHYSIMTLLLKFKR